jgi:predicted ATP-dependent serine protease
MPSSREFWRKARSSVRDVPESAASRSRASRLTGRDVELAVLDRLLESVRVGQSSALVVRGEADVGKTALLEYLAERASDSRCRVVSVAGVQSDTEAHQARHHLEHPVDRTFRCCLQ